MTSRTLFETYPLRSKLVREKNKNKQTNDRRARKESKRGEKNGKNSCNFKKPSNFVTSCPRRPMERIRSIAYTFFAFPSVSPSLCSFFVLLPHPPTTPIQNLLHYPGVTYDGRNWFCEPSPPVMGCITSCQSPAAFGRPFLRGLRAHSSRRHCRFQEKRINPNFMRQ